MISGRVVLLTLPLILFGCATSPVKPTPAAIPIQGTWVLREAGGAPPERIGVGSLQIEFRSDGTTHVETTMTGAFEGMRMNGSGTWRLTDSTLTWITGDNSGTSRVALLGDSLTLEPDPVLVQPGGKGPINTRYARP